MVMAAPDGKQHETHNLTWLPLEIVHWVICDMITRDL